MIESSTSGLESTSSESNCRSSNGQSCKPYARPELLEFGSLATLTKGASATAGDSATTGTVP